MTNPYQYSTAGYLCGSTYDASVRGGLCPSTGTLVIPNPGTPGQYKVAVSPWVVSANGASG